MSIKQSGGHLLAFRRTVGSRNAVLEDHAGEQIGNAFDAPNAPPALLGFLDQLEREPQEGGARQAVLGGVILSTVEPILNPIWVFLFYGESMGKFALVGGLVVLGGVILSAVGSANATKSGEHSQTHDP